MTDLRCTPVRSTACIATGIVLLVVAIRSGAQESPPLGWEEELRAGQDAIWEATLGARPTPGGPISGALPRETLDWLQKLSRPATIPEPTSPIEVPGGRTPEVGAIFGRDRSDDASDNRAGFERDDMNDVLSGNADGIRKGLTIASSSKERLWATGDELTRAVEGRETPVLSAFTLVGDLHGGKLRSRASSAFVRWELDQPTPDDFFIEYREPGNTTFLETAVPETLDGVPPGAPGIYYQGGAGSAGREWAFSERASRLIRSTLGDDADCVLCAGQEKLVCRACQGRKRYTCPDCRRSGEMVCRVCVGEGRLKCPTTWRCQTCGGAGRTACNFVYTEGSGVYAYCSGGTVYASTPVGNTTSTCPQCGGTGYAAVCGSCGGDGIVTCRTCGGSGWKTCACGGDGKVRCATCDARGTIDCSHCGGDDLVCRLCKGRRRLTPFRGRRFHGGPQGVRIWAGGPR